MRILCHNFILLAKLSSVIKNILVLRTTMLTDNEITPQHGYMFCGIGIIEIYTIHRKQIMFIDYNIICFIFFDQ